MEVLLKNKLSRDCIGIIKSYLHENDLEFVKAALDDKYVPNIIFKKFNFNEYEVLCEIDWKLALGQKDLSHYTYYVSIHNYMKVFHKIYKYLNTKEKIDLFKDNGEDIRKNTLQTILDYMYEYDKDIIIDMKRSLYEFGLYYMSDYMLYYLFDTLQIPIDTEYIYYYEKVITEDYDINIKINKLNWLYKHNVQLTLDTFKCAINECDDNKLEIIQWLLDHNCPYKK